MKKRIIFLFCVVAAVASLALTRPADRYFEIAKNLDIFATLFKEVNALYVDDINPNTLVRTGIDAMLASLDPYTNYIPEDEVEDYRTHNTGQYGGIGAITREIGSRTVVTMLIEGYGAHKGGLKIGDEILRIDGIELKGLTREETSLLMRGETGKPVSLTVKRYGEPRPLELTFNRERIKINNVPFFGMVGNDLAYVHLSDFTPEAGREVRNALSQLLAQGAKGVILDLRNNPGGLLIEAVNISNLFLPKGKLVVSTQGKIPENNLKYETLNTPLDTEIPVAVLINRGSASASEIVAGTLQDYDRGVIVGEKSFGKGLVQVSRLLSYNAQLKVTTAKYYTAVGRCIQVLDYAHRREDGSVISIPDSLKQEFRTEHGRVVYDGGGIEPDIAVESLDSHPLTQVLIERGFIFDFVTEYLHKNPKEVNPATFLLTDAEYQQFVNWMKDKDYTYKSHLEYGLQVLREEADKEKYYESIGNELDKISQRLNDAKKNELMRYKDPIKRMIELEIVGRQHFERGRIESGFRHDEEVKRAVAVLHDRDRYLKILGRKP